MELVSSKVFDKIKFDRMENKESISAAFDHVKDFIIRKQRILSGGMSIDYALRLKGGKLYPDDTLPDYDFLSPDHSSDAYTLASELCNKRFGVVEVINAIHVTTMRVRVNGYVVADITYMPPKLFDQLRILEYKGIHILHPWYTVLDQFSALSMPFENSPKEVIVERWKKDNERLKLLLDHYPLNKEPESKTELKLMKIKLPKGGNFILTGWAALAWYNKKSGSTSSITMTDNFVTIPKDYITVLTEDYNSVVKSIKSKTKPKYYFTMMGYPRMLTIDGLHIHDTLGFRWSVGPDSTIASLETTITYFMHRWLRYNDNTDYIGVIQTLEHIKSGKFGITNNVYGTYAWNQSFIYYIRNFYNPSESKLKPHGLIFKADNTDCIPNVPEFKQSESYMYFRIDGSVSKKWEPILDTHIIMYKL